MNAELKNLEVKLAKKDFLLGIIGLGYVGLPLSLTFLRNGIKVLGFDLACYATDQHSSAGIDDVSGLVQPIDHRGRGVRGQLDLHGPALPTRKLEE